MMPVFEIKYNDCCVRCKKNDQTRGIMKVDIERLAILKKRYAQKDFDEADLICTRCELLLKNPKYIIVKEKSK